MQLFCMCCLFFLEYNVISTIIHFELNEWSCSISWSYLYHFQTSLLLYVLWDISLPGRLPCNWPSAISVFILIYFKNNISGYFWEIMTKSWTYCVPIIDPGVYAVYQPLSTQKDHSMSDRRIESKNKETESYEENITKSFQNAGKSNKDTQNRNPIIKDNFKKVEGNFSLIHLVLFHVVLLCTTWLTQ